MARETRQDLVDRISELEAENEALSETLDEVYELVSPDTESTDSEEEE